MNRDALGEQSLSSHVNQASVASHELDRPELLQHLEPPKNLIAGHPCWVVFNASLDVVTSRSALQRHGHELSSDVRNGPAKPLMRTLSVPVRNDRPSAPLGYGQMTDRIGNRPDHKEHKARSAAIPAGSG